MKENTFVILCWSILIGLIIFQGIILVSASDITYEPHKLNTNLSFSYTSNNASSCNITTANTPYGVITINQQSTKIGQTFNNTINGGNFSQIGNYCFNVECSDDGQIATGSICRDITYLGKQLNGARAGLYIGFLTLLILIFFLNFYGMGFLPQSNPRNEEGKIMSISYLKYFRNVLWMTGYFLFIGIMYIASNLAFAFLEEELIAKTLFVIFRVSFMIAPVIVIVWIVYIFASMFHDKQFQNMLNRGIFPGGQL